MMRRESTWQSSAQRASRWQGTTPTVWRGLPTQDPRWVRKQRDGDGDGVDLGPVFVSLGVVAGLTMAIIRIISGIGAL